MKIFTIKQDGIAHLSYLVCSKNEAMVIDPRRDAGVYLEIANREGCIITYVLETHRNEDYVVGSLEIKNLVPSARIGHSKQTAFKYGDDNFSDGETFRVGDMIVTAITTPGHTMDSICYAVADSTISTDPIVCFTGDTLFVNAVGRTDLVDPTKKEDLARELYHSLHEKLLPLGDGVIISPGHGAGSVCGGAIGQRDFSTIGYERQNNILLDLSEDEFVEQITKQHLIYATYFKHCEHLNTIGPPLLNELPVPRPMDAKTFLTSMNLENHIVIDTRQPEAFATSHIPRSLNIPLSEIGLMSGWVLYPDEKILMIVDRPDDFHFAYTALVRLGFDNIIGYLCGGIETWRKSGQKTTSYQVFSLTKLRTEFESKNIHVIDVREKHETEGERIPGALVVPLTVLRSKIGSLPSDTVLAPICASGVRSAIGASVLEQAGLKTVVLHEGIDEWRRLGFPLVD